MESPGAEAELRPSQAGAQGTSSGFVYVAAVFAALGGLLFGYDTGVISGAVLFITKQFALSVFPTELVVAVVLLGAAVGALSGGRIADWLGRRLTLLITSMFFIAGAIICALAGSLSLLVAGRLKWRLTLPFRSGDSSSLSVHWSVIGGFFSWAAAMGYIEKSPIPNPKMNPQFRIRYKKAEVKPPTKKRVEKILATATGQVRLLCQLMRETAMALVDATKYGMSQEDAEKYGMSERRPLIQDRVIRGNRTKTNERYQVRISESLSKQLEALGEPAFPGTYPQWRERVNKVIKDAGVKTTPHGFRHFRITEWLAAGVHVDDCQGRNKSRPQRRSKSRPVEQSNW